MSHNRLGKSCITLLGRLLNITKSLNTLSVSSVGITSASFVGSNAINLNFGKCLHSYDNKYILGSVFLTILDLIQFMHIFIKKTINPGSQSSNVGPTLY